MHQPCEMLQTFVGGVRPRQVQRLELRQSFKTREVRIDQIDLLEVHANYGMVWLNSLFLMSQSFVPFPTGLMGEYPGNPLAVSLFGVVMAVNTLIFIALHAYILKHLLKPELADEQDPHVIMKSLIGPVFYLAGAGVAWVSPWLAFVLYGITPLFFITPISREKLSHHVAGI